MGKELPIPLDSSFARDGNVPYVTGTTSDFVTKFNPPISLVGNKNYEIAVTTATVPYIFFNVTTANNNRTFDYSPDGVVWISYVYEPGLYDLTYLFTTFRDEILIPNNWYVTNGGPGSDEIVYDIEFQPDYPTSKVRIYLANGREVRFPAGTNFGDLLGFNANTTVSTTTLGPNIPNISVDVECILLHCDSSSGVYSYNTQSDVIAILYINAPPLGTISYIPYFPRWCYYIGGDVLTSMRIYLTDQLGRPIDLNDQVMNCELIIREIQ